MKQRKGPPCQATRSRQHPTPSRKVNKYMVARPDSGLSPNFTGGEGQGHPYGFRKLLEDVKDQVPMADVANDLGAGLKPDGKGFRGRGVDHGGDNPTSLMVWPETGRWRCFRCNESGDLLDLWMKAKEFTNKTDALMDLAGTYGVKPTPRPPSFGRKQERQKPVRDALEEIRVRSVHRRLFRIFVRHTLPNIEDEAERRLEAERIWDDLLPAARMIVAGRGS